MTSTDDFKDRVLFTLLSAAFMAAAALVARRAVEKAWQRATGRAPPRPFALAGPAGKKAGEGTARFLIEHLPVLNRLQT